MDTLDINSVLNNDCHTKPVFGGTWSADSFPKTTTSPVCFVVNTAPSWHPGRHWVAIYRGVDGDEYFCSYGSKPAVEIQRNLRKDYTSNCYMLQSPTSDICGQYCILYLLCKCRGFSLQTFTNCFSSDTFINDKLVVKSYKNYINRNHRRF
jgi:hypothetical protein